jgi:hypothetical protein
MHNESSKTEQPSETIKIGNIMRTSQLLLDNLFPNGSRARRTRVFEVTSTVDRPALAAGELRVTVNALISASGGSETRTLVLTGEDAITFVEQSINTAGLSPQG